VTLISREYQRSEIISNYFNVFAFARGRHALLPLHFSLPWVRPSHGTIAVNVTWIDREFNARQTPHSMYPSIFNRFPVIQHGSSNVRHFSTFFAHFGLPWSRPWDNRGKCHTVGKRILRFASGLT